MSFLNFNFWIGFLAGLVVMFFAFSGVCVWASIQEEKILMDTVEKGPPQTGTGPQ